MGQYTVFPTDAAYVEIEDATGTKFRLEHSASVKSLTLKQTLTDLGFDGVVDVDYVALEFYAVPAYKGEKHRIGVRDGCWVIDQTLYPDHLEFWGVEDVDWKNIESHKL